MSKSKIKQRVSVAGKTSRKKLRGGNGGNARGRRGRVLESHQASKVTQSAFEKVLIQEFGLKTKEATAVWRSLHGLISESLLQGVSVKLTGVGTLEPYDKKSTQYRHPTTGAVRKAPSRRHIRFILAPKLREKLRV